MCFVRRLPMVLFLFAGSLFADEWRQFRGPGARGVSVAEGLPDRWSETENIVWKTPIPGRGWSSPIVAGQKVFITTVTRKVGKPEDAKPGLYFGGNRNQPDDVEHEWKMLCFDLDSGSELWSKTLHQGKPATPRHIKNSYASETPATDGELVYALFGDVGVYCLTVDGKPVWSKELPARKTRDDWGTAASPVVHQDRLYWVNDNQEESCLVAVNKRTGEQAWRVDRPEKSNWATPFVWENDQRTEIVTPGSGKVRSYDLAGKLLYEFGGCSSITIATPYAAHGLLFVTSGYVGDRARPIFALRPGAAGDISLKPGETANRFIAWSLPQAAPYNPSTIVVGDLLYVLHDRGLLSAYNAQTGAVVYDKVRIEGGRGFTVSPWADGDRLFCLNEHGDTFVIQTGLSYKLLRTNHLDSKELCMATPALIGRRLILRTGDALYCIGAR